MIKAALIATVFAGTFSMFISPVLALNPIQLAQNKSTATATVENGASSQTESTSTNRSNLKLPQSTNGQIQTPATATTQGSSSNTVTPSAPLTNTEGQNDTPVANPSAEVNNTLPENANTDAPPKENVTERTTIQNNTTADAPRENNVMYIAIFGILALLIIAVLAVITIRRRGN